MPKAVLLAEDSREDETLFRLVMRRSGLANPVLVVRDGDEAIAYLKGESRFADRKQFPLPNVLFLDLKMPRVNGFEVLEWLKTQPPLDGMLVVVLTLFGDTKEIRRAYEMGADSFLTKPITQADLDNLTKFFEGHWDRDGKTRDMGEVKRDEQVHGELHPE